jgi:hypothetical protein
MARDDCSPIINRRDGRGGGARWDAPPATATNSTTMMVRDDDVRTIVFDDDDDDNDATIDASATAIAIAIVVGLRTWWAPRSSDIAARRGGRPTRRA